jgi:thymidylate kinase
MTAAGLRVVVLHGGGGSRDLDVLVDRPDLAAGALASIPGSSHVQAIRYGPEATTYILRRDGAWLPVDVVAALRYGGILYLSGAEVLAGARPDGSPTPALDFAYYLAKRLIKRGLGPDQIANLRALFARDEPGCREAWTRLLPPETVGDWTALPNLRGAMIRHGWRTRAATFAPWASLARLAGRVWRPTGFLVVVLGPDGVGKSTLIDGLADALRPAFWRVRKRHLRPNVLRRGHGGDSHAPHDQPIRGPYVSSLQAVLWIADYFVGHVVSVYPGLVRSTLVLFDRYADDLAVDPRRYRFGGPPWLARLVGRLAPRPDLTLVLTADAGAVQARRREVPAAETARQLVAYATLADAREDVVLLDAGRAPEVVLARATELALARLARRTAHRLRLDR